MSADRTWINQSGVRLEYKLRTELQKEVWGGYFIIPSFRDLDCQFLIYKSNYDKGTEFYKECNSLGEAMKLVEDLTSVVRVKKTLSFTFDVDIPLLKYRHQKICPTLQGIDMLESLKLELNTNSNNILGELIHKSQLITVKSVNLDNPHDIISDETIKWKQT